MTEFDATTEAIKHNYFADQSIAAQFADRLIATEIAKQDEMWGASNERPDVSERQLPRAAMAQLEALYQKQRGITDAFEREHYIYPEDWKGFRDYGSDIANLVVAAAFLRQEIKRLLMAGEDYTRTSRS